VLPKTIRKFTSSFLSTQILTPARYHPNINFHHRAAEPQASLHSFWAVHPLRFVSCLQVIAARSSFVQIAPAVGCRYMTLVLPIPSTVLPFVNAIPPRSHFFCLSHPIRGIWGTPWGKAFFPLSRLEMALSESSSPHLVAVQTSPCWVTIPTAVNQKYKKRYRGLTCTTCGRQDCTTLSASHSVVNPDQASAIQDDLV
jgi:hypothetical protein